ncbi:DsbC family protein [Methylophilaceae bacterium]|jgi:thiol:disulfide interchange protein DsbC|nr:DsbC family protein [Methylophilaceae bacterium]
MTKIITIFLCLFISIIAFAKEDELRKIIKKTYPELNITSLKKTDYNDLYEVFIGNQIIYTNENFDFLIVEGRVVDPKTKIDLTEVRLEELTRINFNDLPLSDAIKVVKGNGKRKIAIFSDVDCPYCKRLEKEELSNVDNITMYTFLYPLAIHPEAEEKSKKIWCAKDRAEAWSEYIFKDKLPKNSGDCKTPINQILKLGKDLGISSTPTIILPNGKRVAGAIPYKQLEEYLQ